MKDVLSVSKKPAPQSHRSPKRPEKGRSKNTRPSLPASAFLPGHARRGRCARLGAARLRLRYPATPTWIIPRSASAIISAGAGVATATRWAFIAQPDWNEPGERRGCSASRGWDSSSSAGNMDSMVNHYTVNKKRRRRPTPTRRAASGRRAPRPRGRGLFATSSAAPIKETPIILGGIEASLRRLAHYDYWSDSAQALHLAGLRGRSHLLRHGGALHRRDCRCPGLRALSVSDLTFIDGTVYPDAARWNTSVDCHDAAQRGKRLRATSAPYAESFAAQYRNERSGDAANVWWKPYGRTACTWCRTRRLQPLTQQEMDDVYRSTLCAHVASLLRRRPAACRRFPEVKFCTHVTAAAASARAASAP